MAEEMNQNPTKRQRMLSLIQPSGVPTLGNYLGALKNWKEYDADYDCFYGVAEKEGGPIMSSEDFATELIKRHKVAVVPGNVFGAGGEGFVRCCYATEIGLLKEALKRMSLVIGELKK